MTDPIPPDAAELRTRLRDAEWAVQRAQTAAYYAHQTFLQSRTPEAAEGYRAALRRCQEAIDALLAVDAAFRTSLLH